LKQVQRVAHRLKRKLESDLGEETIGYLNEHLQSLELRMDSPDDEVGVLPGWKANGPANAEDAASEIIFFMTSKELMKLIMVQQNGPLKAFVSMDATYKLTICGYPCIVVGTVDVQHHFHLVGLMISRHEDTAAFQKAVESIKRALHTFFDFIWEPVVSMSDSAGAILNALTNEFPGIACAVCYFHMVKGVKDHASLFSTEKALQLFLSELKIIAGFGDEQVFDAAFELFLARWLRKEKNAIDWFIPSWGTGIKKRWFSGASGPGLPKTNNSLEGTNNVIKEFVTGRHRVLLGVIIKRFKSELKYQTNLAKRNKFLKIPQFSRHIFVEAQKWLRVCRQWIVKLRNTTYFVPSSTTLENVSKTTLKESLAAYRKSPLPSNENFVAFVTRITSFWKLEILPQPLGHNFYSCTCPSYADYAQCKHSVGLSLANNHIEVPAPWKSNKFEDGSKRGRPRGATKALSRN
jgi:hypothetical protein